MEYFFLVLLIAYAAWTMFERSRHWEERQQSRRAGSNYGKPPEPILALRDLLPFLLIKLLADGDLRAEQYPFLVRMKPKQLTSVLQNHELLPLLAEAHRLALEQELTDRHLFSQQTVVKVLHDHGPLSSDQLRQLQSLPAEEVQTRLMDWGLLPSYMASLDLLSLQEMMLRQ